MPTLEKLMHEYFREKAELLYNTNPWVFYALESALVSVAGGIHIAKGKDFYIEPAMHYIALVGPSGRGKNWAANVFESIAEGVFEYTPFGSGQAWLEHLQRAVNKSKRAVARTYTFIDEATSILRAYQSWGGELIDWFNRAWNGQRLTWVTRDKRKMQIDIPSRSYMATILLATTIQRWSVLEARLGEAGLTRRFWVLNVDTKMPKVQEEEPDLDQALKLSEMCERIRLALRALKGFMLIVRLTGLKNVKANEKIDSLELPELRKFAVGEYTLRLTASRLVASAIEVPGLDEFTNYHDAMTWVRERMIENLENRGVEIMETPEFLAKWGVALEQDLKPWKDYILDAKVTGNEPIPKTPKEAEERARQLDLKRLADPLNFDINLILVTSALAEVIEAHDEAISDLIYMIKELRRKGELVMPRKNFVRLYLKMAAAKDYNPTIEALMKAGVIRVVTRAGIDVDESALYLGKRLYIVTDPEAKICANCEKAGTEACPKFMGLDQFNFPKALKSFKLDDSACAAFELKEG